jgi:group I intron endonuclease
MTKISAVYQIINTVTNDRYVGSSKDVFRRWASHKWSSKWKQQPNNPLYQDMQKYGVEKFRFQILAPVMPEYLKQVEQEFIEMLHPIYNNYWAKGWDVERKKEYRRKYNQSGKGNETQRKYSQSEKGKGTKKKYDNQLCYYNGETLTLCALVARFHRARVKNPTLEAKKYLKK